MSRGDRREDILLEDNDRNGVLATLGQGCDKTRSTDPVELRSWLLRGMGAGTTVQDPRGVESLFGQNMLARQAGRAEA